MAGISPGHLHFRERLPPRRYSTRWWGRWRSAVQQRGDVADGDATVLPFRFLRRNFQILLTVTLRGEVFRRDAELPRQQLSRGLGAAIRQRQVVDVGPDRVGVALDQEHRAGVGRDRAIES